MYYGHYRSSVISQTGCVKEFVTIEKDNLIFPPQLMMHCDLCGTTHNFRLTNTHMAATPRQHRAFDEYCKQNNLQTNVEFK